MAEAAMTLLEERVADVLGRRFCLLVGSGTTALYVAFLGLDLGPGRRVLYPDMVCETAVNAAVFAGIEPCFCDVDSATLGLDPADAAGRAAGMGAVVPVHLFGQLVDIPLLERLLGSSGIPVVEDAAQAYGGSLGSLEAGRLGRLAVVSFGPNKLLDCGGGGALLTDEPGLHQACAGHARQLSADPAAQQAARAAFMREMFAQGKSGLAGAAAAEGRCRALREHRSGYVYALPSQAAERIAQRLGEFPAVAARRKAFVASLRQALAGVPGLAVIPAHEGAAAWRFSLLVEGRNRDRLFDNLLKRGIGVSRLFEPMHRKFNGEDGQFPNASGLSERIVNISLDMPGAAPGRLAEQVAAVVHETVGRS
ncbi:MAG: DegT/DnrJ/EryC1/StrS family aminotransferase [Thermodesulfobacteriota bacterium]